MSLYSPELSYCRGSAFSALRRFDEAIAAFQQAIALGQHGHWVGEAGAFGYKANYGIALAYVELGDYTRAAEFAGKAAAQKPDDPEAHQLAAAACMRVKLHDRAEEHLLQLASLKPGDSSVTARLADLYHGQGRFEEAKQQYGVLLEAGHDTPAIRTRLAECMKALGEDDAARRHSAQAAQLRADAQTQTDLGRRLAAEGRVVEALQCFAAAVGADPTHADAYFAAGDVLYAAGEYQRAAEIYQSGLLHSPESAAGFFAIGNCYLRMGAGDAAALAYRQALALRPDYPEAEESLHVAEDLLLQPQAA
jgi:tetratricopeptide (TPR) repeat protein